MAEGLVAHDGPEELLRGALEKIVFFECRVSQLDAELTAARSIVTREKEAQAVSRAREVELEMLLAQARGELATLKSRSIELEERVRLLEAERQRFLSGMVQQAQVAGAPGDTPGEHQGEKADLAGFIAELRAEIERLRLWKAAAEKAGVTIDNTPDSQPIAPVPPVSTLAARFEQAGRLGLGQDEAHSMKDQLVTRAERSLYETSMEDLSAPDPDRRKRAADCLRALGSPAAAPILATALGRESDAVVKAALLAALAATGESSTAALAFREISDPRPEVRAAALDAVAALAKDTAEGAITAALGDPSSMVRRRAILLLGYLPGANAADALAAMLSDRDPGVARAAALALSGRPNVRAQSALAKALEHQQPAVRRHAADAVARWAGEAIDPDSTPVERRRTARRMADKLATLEESDLRKAVVFSSDNTMPSAQPQKQAAAHGAPPARDRRTAQPRVAAAVAKAQLPPVAAVGESGELENVLIGEIRASIRGRTVEELSHFANAGHAEVSALLARLVERTMLSQRGSRFFLR